MEKGCGCAYIFLFLWIFPPTGIFLAWLILQTGWLK